jgi:tetrapyrrole methylase family protein/MazG family protein
VKGAAPDPRAQGEAFARLVSLIERLRAPGGCPWDREQTHESLKPMAIEEAYELVEAIDEGRDEDLVGELGDLLLQVVFHAQIGAEEGRFTAKDVADRVSEKMVRRHPHVFGDDSARTSGEVLKNWETLKAAERQAKGTADGSMLDSVSKAHPAVMEAYQITTKAARVGFDWKNASAVLGKLDEELGELREALAGGGKGTRAVAEEVGDLLFVAVNLARKAGVDPESALKAANRKFRRRFRHIEERLRAGGRSPAQSTLEEMDALWQEAKEREHASREDM